jgi:hypothetical protein
MDSAVESLPHPDSLPPGEEGSEIVASSSLMRPREIVLKLGQRLC